jgi:hypothetical protein
MEFLGWIGFLVKLDEDVFEDALGRYCAGKDVVEDLGEG